MAIIMIQQNDCQTERQGPENVPLSWVQQLLVYQFRKSRVAYSYHSQEDVCWSLQGVRVFITPYFQMSSLFN